MCFAHMYTCIWNNAATFAVASLNSFQKGTSNSLGITKSHLRGEERERLDRTRRTSAEGKGQAPREEVDCFCEVRSHKADWSEGG